MNHTDWFNYGGIHREVSLVRVPAVFIQDFGAALVPGSGGRRLRVDVRLSEAIRCEAEVEIAGLGGPYRIQVTDGCGAIEIEAQPRLWQPARPTLYDVTVRCGDDSVGDRIGFREIAVDGRRLLLNGEDLFLRGICVHEDDAEQGRVTSDPTFDSSSPTLRAQCQRSGWRTIRSTTRRRIADERDFCCGRDSGLLGDRRQSTPWRTQTASCASSFVATAIAPVSSSGAWATRTPTPMPASHS
jgi:hypothetical protein